MYFWPHIGCSIALLFLGLATSVHARIGETEFQCNERYGDGQEDRLKIPFTLVDGARHREFHYGGWLIRIAFVDGKAVREEYLKSGSKDGPKINEDELQAILQGEQGEGTWKLKPAEVTIFGLLTGADAATKAKTWIRSDGALAIMRPGGLIVRVESADAADIDKRMKAAKEDQRQKSVPKF